MPAGSGLVRVALYADLVAIDLQKEFASADPLTSGCCTQVMIEEQDVEIAALVYGSLGHDAAVAVSQAGPAALPAPFLPPVH